ncbi:hypothetical protein [Mesorhizobium sp. CN2-181]|uniref:hypothetical protein n=1 Tax=Mesorhizobium yinganensis TaxID=3157707 RepID=UPI0032B8297D
MIKNRNSRHNGLATYRVPIPGRDGTADICQPRFRPTVLPETVTQAISAQDRLDTLASALTGDPQGFWRLADLNRSYDPASLLDPGRTIRVPRRVR